jgi:hypothetical protein
MTEPNDPSHPEPDWHDERPLRGNRPPVGALILLGLAALFVLHQFGFAFTDRWWTAFVLIPAGGALVAATRFFRAAGGWTPPAVGATVFGVLLMGLWAKLFFGFGAAWHFAGVHAVGWHGHFLFPLILLAVAIAVFMRRSRWQR